MATVVETLRNVLERAEQGHITGVAIAVCEADLSTGSCWSLEAASQAEMLGAILLLQAAMLATAGQRMQPDDAR